MVENFSQQFHENTSSIVHICNIKTTIYSTPTMQNSIYFPIADEHEIFEILKSINVNKGPGIDNIRPADLKNNCNVLTPVITKIINASMSEASVPHVWKTSVIRPIFKNGKKNDYGNYRPISILPIVEKVMEEIVTTRLNNFITKYKLINKMQFGFQKGKGINQLLGLFTNHVNRSMSLSMNSLVLFVDFTKAFDTICHSKLLNILENCGIRGNCLEWFKNYLDSR